MRRNEKPGPMLMKMMATMTCYAITKKEAASPDKFGGFASVWLK